MKVRVEPATLATPESLAEIEALLRISLPRPRPWGPDLAWLYLANPRGPAWFVNARTEAGELVAHHGALRLPPMDHPRYGALTTYFIVHAIVHPAAPVPGLMVATARALCQHLGSLSPALVFGVANEKSFSGYTRLTGFRSLGRLTLRLHAPYRLPAEGAPKALVFDESYLRWRAARPETNTYVTPRRGAVIRRVEHRGLPVDIVLSVGLPGESLSRLDLPRHARGFWPAAPRLYASFGGAPPGGFAVPERLRPSPLEYMVRLVDRQTNADELAAHLMTRRFEFYDFDVI